VFWINDSNLESGPGIFMFNGFQPQKISTPDVDFDLGRHIYSDLRIAGVAEFFGYNYLFIKTGDQSTDYYWVFCFETGIWGVWESTLAATGNIVMNNNFIGSGAENEVLLYSGVKVHKFDIESMLSTDMDFTDNGSAYTMTIQTGINDFGSMNRKVMNRLSIVGSRPRAASATNISFSDDDYVSFGTARSVDMNAAYPSITRCGSFRRRAIRITNAANTPFQAEAIDVDVVEGTG
jgi:hypothetical protein